ncbi:androgen-dependent TFPI-regulating protein-like [Oppia nitens]|uniref:androgen-dependent TFPI-regulating protein-like n=1 Tax=Oppia nitens TaxID=1686743 RepID=UPI0023DC6F6B|nr:androgen-dependent TFPI-regulating protein-like [Oppia nitens]
MSVKSYPLSVLIHMISMITYGYSICWQFLHVLPPGSERYGRLKYLTYWNLWIQFITFTVSLVADFISNPNNNSRNKNRPPTTITVRDTLFNSLALPLAIFVSISFWGLYAIDRQLIFPVGIEKWYPNWLNHCTHTIILPIVLLDNYLVCHTRRSKKTELSLLFAVIIGYGVWVLFMGLTSDVWVYPILTKLNWPLRASFMLSSCLVITSFYYFGVFLYDMSWKSSAAKHKIETRNKLK